MAFGLVAALAGCDAGPVDPTSSSPPSPAPPIFASDEEALAAAEAAYAAYAAASAAIGSEGGAGVERLRELVDIELYEQSVQEFQQFEQLGLRSEGASTVKNVVIADNRTMGDQVFLSAYLCRDVSEVRILGPAGDDVTPQDRDDVQPLLVAFQGDRERLVISQIESWKDKALCE